MSSRFAAGRKEKLTINNAVVSGTHCGGVSGPSWWEVSSQAAGKIMSANFPGKRKPRPGYEVVMPESTHKGHRGKWALANRAGQYEVMFYYR